MRIGESSPNPINPNRPVDSKPKLSFLKQCLSNFKSALASLVVNLSMRKVSKEVPANAEKINKAAKSSLDKLLHDDLKSDPATRYLQDEDKASADK